MPNFDALVQPLCSDKHAEIADPTKNIEPTNILNCKILLLQEINYNVWKTTQSTSIERIIAVQEDILSWLLLLIYNFNKGVPSSTP